eukprot:Gb_37133 [translate_table: standard]
MAHLPLVSRLCLGFQGFEVSAQGLGCMGMNVYYGPPKSKEEMINLIRYAISKGITFLYTSDVYGPFTNKILVGKGIKGIRVKVLGKLNCPIRAIQVLLRPYRFMVTYGLLGAFMKFLAPLTGNAMAKRGTEKTRKGVSCQLVQQLNKRKQGLTMTYPELVFRSQLFCGQVRISVVCYEKIKEKFSSPREGISSNVWFRLLDDREFEVNSCIADQRRPNGVGVLGWWGEKSPVVIIVEEQSSQDNPEHSIEATDSQSSTAVDDSLLESSTAVDDWLSVT